MYRALFVTAAVVLTLGAAATAAGAHPAPGEPNDDWTTYGVYRFDTNTVTLTDEDRTLAFDVTLAGGADCWRNLTATLGDDEGWTDAYARVRFVVERRSDPDPAACTTPTAARATVALPAALGGRDVVVNSFDVYTRDGAGSTLRLCGEDGCHPAPTGCTPASYDQAMRAADSPRHTYRTERGCDGSWLVLDLSYNAGPVCEPHSPGCVPHVRTARWFFRAEPTGWQVVAQRNTAGCAGVHAVEPTFPEALCASLPAVP